MQTVNDRADFLVKLKPFLPEKPSCIEIGALYGDFSQMILDILQPSYLKLIDPFVEGEKAYRDGLKTAYSTEQDYQNILLRFAPQIKTKQIRVHRGYSYNLAELFTNGFYNLVYLDASHLYEDVKRDLNDWFPKLKPGGILAGHDYIINGDFGVIQAVDEFCKEHNLEIFLFNNNGGDWAIKI